jgi:hypothetical protein
MKVNVLLGFFIYLCQLLSSVFSYLSTSEYRSYTPIKGDFSSLQFYSYFSLNLNFYPNDPLQYIRNCGKGTYFGFFRNGDITNYFDYNKYGTIAINFDIAIQKARFMSHANDTLDFYLNGKLAHKLNLDKFTENPESSSLCDKEVNMFKVSIVYKNENFKYPPLAFKVSTNFNSLSNIDWAITNMQLVKVDCPAKCSVCDPEQCVSCNEPNTIFETNTCTCDFESDFYDYSDESEPLKCNRIFLI